MLRKVSIKVLDLDSSLCFTEYDMEYNKLASKLKHLEEIMSDEKFMNRCNIYFKLGFHFIISAYTIHEVIDISEIKISHEDYYTYMHVGKLLGNVYNNSDLIRRLINDIIDEYSMCQSMDVEGIEYDPKIDIYLEQDGKGYRY